MIAKLSEFKPWILATAAVLGSLLAVIGVGALANLALSAWPEAAETILVVRLVAGSVVAWIVIGIFVEAIALGKRIIWFEAAMERIVDEHLAALEEDEEDIEQPKEEVESKNG